MPRSVNSEARKGTQVKFLMTWSPPRTIYEGGLLQMRYSPDFSSADGTRMALLYNPLQLKKELV